MPIWTKTDSLLEGITSVQRDTLKVQMEIEIMRLIKHLKTKFKRYGSPGYNLERALTSTINQANIVNLSSVQLADLILTANNNVFKLPMEPYNHYYQVQYYNSTEHTLNIENMGIVSPEGIPVLKVAPGGLVNIPHHYTVGGDYSVVTTNAPQLRPVPTKLAAKDRILDLQPCSYMEWIVYHEYNNSRCCTRHTLWSDVNQKLYCAKCCKQVLV